MRHSLRYDNCAGQCDLVTNPYPTHLNTPQSHVILTPVPALSEVHNFFYFSSAIHPSNILSPEYQRMADAIAAAHLKNGGLPMILSLCEWGWVSFSCLFIRDYGS
jgi:hypothetical protein